MSLPPQPWVPGTGLGSGDTGPPADPAPPFCGREATLSESRGVLGRAETSSQLSLCPPPAHSWSPLWPWGLDPWIPDDLMASARF